VIAFPVRRLFLARAVTDMRRSFDTLSGMVSSQLGHDPHSGDAFIFVGKDRRRMKVIFWDGDGFWLCARRLARGTFALPAAPAARDATEVMPLDAAQWALLLAGITVLEQRRSRRYHHVVQACG
jgi:transposase